MCQRVLWRFPLRCRLHGQRRTWRCSILRKEKNGIECKVPSQGLLRPNPTVSDCIRPYHPTVSDCIRHILPYPTVSDCIRPYPTVSYHIRLYPTVSDCIRPYPTISDCIRPYPTVFDCFRLYISDQIPQNPKKSGRIWRSETVRIASGRGPNVVWSLFISSGAVKLAPTQCREEHWDPHKRSRKLEHRTASQGDRSALP